MGKKKRATVGKDMSSDEEGSCLGDLEEQKPTGELQKKKKKKSDKTDNTTEMEEVEVKPKKKKRKKEAATSYRADMGTLNPNEPEIRKSKKSKKDKSEVDPKDDGGQSPENSETGEKIILPQPRPEVDAGQWNTAELGDTQRQNKFLKLMGGFKKGSTSSAGESAPKPFLAKFNAALNKRQEENLNKGLETQFSQAQQLRLGTRGVGLGFSDSTSNPNKIDTTKLD